MRRPGTTFTFPAWSPDGSRVAARRRRATTAAAIEVFGAGSSAETDGTVALPERRAGAVLPVLDARRARGHLPDRRGRGQPRAPLGAGRWQRRGDDPARGRADVLGLGGPGPDARPHRGGHGRLPGRGRRWTAAPSRRWPARPACSGRRRRPPTAATRRTRSASPTARRPSSSPRATGRPATSSRSSARRPSASPRPARSWPTSARARATARRRFPLGPLRIVDASTGEVRELPAKDVVAFFWSPDGTRIATLGLADPVRARARPPAGPAAGGARLASVGRGGADGGGRPPVDAPGDRRGPDVRGRRGRDGLGPAGRVALAAVRQPGAAVLRPVRAEPPRVVARRVVDPAPGGRARTAPSRSTSCRPTGRRCGSWPRARWGSGAPRAAAASSPGPARSRPARAA